eukprot:2865185-Prymnesium_polylepis.1
MHCMPLQPEARVGARGVVWLRREARQALLVKVDYERVHARHEHVQPKVEFEVADEHRPTDVRARHPNVPLHLFGVDAICACVQRLRCWPVQEDAVSAAECGWLEDPDRCISLLKAVAQVLLVFVGLLRQHEAERHEVEDIVAV